MNKSFSRWWGLGWKWTHGPFSPKKTKRAKKPAAPGKQELWPQNSTQENDLGIDYENFAFWNWEENSQAFPLPRFWQMTVPWSVAFVFQLLCFSFQAIEVCFGFFFPLEPHSPISLFLSSMRAKHHFPFDLTHRWVQLGTLVFIRFSPLFMHSVCVCLGYTYLCKLLFIQSWTGEPCCRQVGSMLCSSQIKDRSER